MLDHDEMEHQQEYDVVEIDSPDGSNKRKVGLCAVLSDDPALYSHFKAPGAFGGATITDPWEALTKYKDILENQEGCDTVLPLQHLYVPDDHRTCRDFDFPVILSGHDHHRVDEVVEGTRLSRTSGSKLELEHLPQLVGKNG
jgi:2',3'-cyclic-nucleotide 2'-phosphodiesterase (5'-nucleotidase family)